MTLNSTSDALSDETLFTQKMSINHTRVAVIGSVDAGKSTLIGTLTTGILDDGRGQSRNLITKYKHEIETGRTSTISSHLLGFNTIGKPIVSSPSFNATKRKLKTEDKIAAEADKIVSLVDLAGHEKYLKTTIHGVSSGMVDYALVLVNAKHPPTHMTLQHIGLVSAYGIPIVIVLTKIDGCPKHVLKNTKDEINAIIRSPQVQKQPFVIKKEADVHLVKDKMHAIAPFVHVSSVTADGLALLNHLLFSLPKRRRHYDKIGKSFEFLVDDTFFVTGVGLIVSGLVNAGKTSIGNKVWVGPLNDGSFLNTMVKSIHLARTSVGTAISGNTACLALSLDKGQRKLLRKGMVVLDEPAEVSSVFEATMFVTKGSGVDGTTIGNNYQTMVHILHMKQAATIERIQLIQESMICHSNSSESGVIIRPGSRAKIRFRFTKRKEFIRVGMRVLFRDGCVRASGTVTAVGVEKNDGESV
mmetsp:Transcript_23495/g.27739  ORF Transcript_23495/g.27739 Transcript_23495/m.27739 type:complete len:471 (+) Transcript_23495:134-1546(+)|eukprot:CAMPEP_0198265510 /NCGR_PEP_ID=MMETSP1447-20131203/22887_1 /TAXON_ID=420782 /ORGANISM="Chaetoceros dichaeta, Strain CCMP1751" /LENGTH=470 /DNA_ID=CAMNT_0043955037 /DNA_START=49 /DNA_END=1461 /DNA_ORIENTATION=+